MYTSQNFLYRPIIPERYDPTHNGALALQIPSNISTNASNHNNKVMQNSPNIQVKFEPPQSLIHSKANLVSASAFSNTENVRKPLNFCPSQQNKGNQNTLSHTSSAYSSGQLCLYPKSSSNYTGITRTTQTNTPPIPTQKSKCNVISTNRKTLKRLSTKKHNYTRSSDDHSCTHCGHKYANRSGLYKHIKNKHPGEVSLCKGRIICNEQNCEFICYHLHSLRTHLTDAHDLAMESDHFQFSSTEGTCKALQCIISINFMFTYAEFESWKEETERATDTNFVKSTGLKPTEADLETKTYYYCNRSGYFSSISTGKRSLKSQGTSKLNTYCTAGMTVTQMNSKCVNVDYCSTHYGHEISLGHLRISDKDRKMIAGKLKQGVSFEHIMDTIRDSVGSKFERIHLLT